MVFQFSINFFWMPTQSKDVESFRLVRIVGKMVFLTTCANRPCTTVRFRPRNFQDRVLRRNLGKSREGAFFVDATRRRSRHHAASPGYLSWRWCLIVQTVHAVATFLAEVSLFWAKFESASCALCAFFSVDKSLILSVHLGLASSFFTLRPSALRRISFWQWVGSASFPSLARQSST